ncbi:hypothetical protein FACS189479_09790 [Spirochaetia bacterium]|nr:hypothetical protein FACS189479_09790 [Spirochaetia bacterium]
MADEQGRRDPFMFADPDEVKAEVKTWAWLMGNLPNDNSLTDNDLFGIWLIGHMIAENVAHAIDKLVTENHDLREQLIHPGRENEA